MLSSKTDEYLEFTQLIPFRLNRLSSKLNRQAYVLMERWGEVTVAQWRVLLILYRTEVDTLSEIAAITGVDKGLLSRSIAPLVRDQQIEVVRDGEDMRIKRLKLTGKGVTLCRRLEPIKEWRQRRLCAEFSRAELELLNSMLDRLEAAADDHSYRP